MIEFTSVNKKAMTANAMMVSKVEADGSEIDGTTRVVTHRPTIVAINRAIKSIRLFLRTGTLLAQRTPMG